MTSVPSSVHLISLNYDPFIYLSAVLFKKGCIFRQEPEQWHLGGLVGISELRSISSQNECKIILQKVPSFFLVATTLPVLILIVPKVTKGAWEELQTLFTLDSLFPSCSPWPEHSCSSTRGAPGLHRPLALHIKFLNLGRLPCPINFHKA